MFFLKEEERTITLHPSFFGPNIQRYLDDQLLSDVEGTVQGDYFVVCVLEPHDYSEGKIVPGSAFAEFKVHYRAVVWKPFKGEVVRKCPAKGIKYAAHYLRRLMHKSPPCRTLASLAKLGLFIFLCPKLFVIINMIKDIF